MRVLTWVFVALIVGISPSWAAQINSGGGGGGAADGVGYDEIDDEGVALTKRAILNMTGAGVTCVDNAGSTRTDCTISAPTHALLSATHTDTTAGAPVTGDLLIGDSGLWGQLGGPTSASERCLVSTGTGTVANPPTWSACSGVTANTGASPAIAATDNRKVVTYTNASPVAATIAQAGTTGFATGWYSYHRNVGSTVVTITPTTSTIGGLTTLVLDPGEGALIVSDGTNYQVMRGGSTSSINAQTGVSYTISRDDANNLVTTSNAGAIATTLPQATTAGFTAGFMTFVKNIGAGTNTITPTTSTINGAASLALTTNQWAVIFSDGANYIALKGDDAGGGGSGDITDVFACATGNCNALTAASGDSLSMASGDSSIPVTTSASLPGTCTEGQHHQDTDSGGTETYVCTTSNAWIKLGEASESLPVSTFAIAEEFCGGLTSAGNIGTTGTYTASGTASYATAVASHPCILNMVTGSSAGNYARIFFSPNDSNPMVMGDVQKMRFIIRPQSLDADTAIRCGFIVTTSTVLEGSDGVYMSYLNSASAN